MTAVAFFFGVLCGIWATICYATLARWSVEELEQNERDRWRMRSRLARQRGARERGPYSKRAEP